jgi:hypothetical protein
MSAAARALDDGRSATEVADLLHALPHDLATTTWLRDLGADISALRDAIIPRLDSEPPASDGS